MRRARTDIYNYTISGLLTKRADLFNEAQVLRDRLAEIKNDIDALDRTLGVLGYDGDLDAQMPRQKRHVLFGRGELSRQVFQVLREAGKPLTSRQIAQEIVSMSGMDARDRKFIGDLTKRVGKALRQSPVSGILWSSPGLMDTFSIVKESVFHAENQEPVPCGIQGTDHRAGQGRSQC